MLEPGDAAPAFELPGTAGSDVETYGLPDGICVLAFYRFDFHPACTEAICTVNDLDWFQFTDGLSVYGLSTDSVYSHRAFAREQALGYPLLADHDGRVAEAYGVLLDRFRGHGRVADRAVFVVEDRTVRYAWRADDPADRPDWTAVLDVVDDLGPAAE